MHFLLDLSHYVKSYGHFCQIWPFYDERSPNMVMSSDPRANFENFLFCPNSILNIRKSHKISSGKALSTSEVISQTPHWGEGEGVGNTPSGEGVGNTPSAFGVKVELAFFS